MQTALSGKSIVAEYFKPSAPLKSTVNVDPSGIPTVPFHAKKSSLDWIVDNTSCASDEVSKSAKRRGRMACMLVTSPGSVVHSISSCCRLGMTTGNILFLPPGEKVKFALVEPLGTASRKYETLGPSSIQA
eukprot:GHVS01069329.1.p2 GENE.GHVS01069329.1~~GHVS01069329.1.p2  ORF type:complete len:131 (-),score=12.46 GHVS01069329.1:64-456(-)